MCVYIYIHTQTYTVDKYISEKYVLNIYMYFIYIYTHIQPNLKYKNIY